MICSSSAGESVLLSEFHPCEDLYSNNSGYGLHLIIGTVTGQEVSIGDVSDLLAEVVS